MDNALPDYDQDDDGPPMPTEAELLAMMEESDLNRQTSRGIPLDEAVAKLDAAIERIEARIRARAA